jgi:5-methylcytosine-specific restriction protein B
MGRSAGSGRGQLRRTLQQRDRLGGIAEAPDAVLRKVIVLRMAPDSGAASFEQALAEFDPAAYAAFEHEAELQREETLSRYPRERWPQMTLEEYAQGQEGNPDNFCRWMERQTEELASIRGGSARKFIIYKHREKPGWYFPPEYSDEQAAWHAVRDGFVRAFTYADEGRWDEIQEIDPLNRGGSLLTKTLWIYFPTELLPITSSDHLRHFLEIAGRDDLASDQSIRTVGLNRALLAELRSHSELAEASPKVLERFLYTRFSPLRGRVVKIAPGRDAEFWPDCMTGNYICVGWEKVGDLRQFESKEAFLAAFRDAYGSTYTTEAKLKEKADEVWLLLDLAVGERIVANKGTKEILAVGTIQSPGYAWNAERESHNHTVVVQWDESFAKEIPPQPYWAFKTVQPLSGKVRALVLGEEEPEAGVEPAPPVTLEEPLFERIADALERKGQAILYGPPGTGKTWHANAFARWWLRKRNANIPATKVTPSVAEDTGRAWLVSTRPSEWRWDELFEQGQQQFRRGRLDRNYDAISAGDLVFGYTATPEKRIESLARVARLEQADGKPTFVLAPLARVKDGPTWDELQADPYLGGSEPIRNRMQGTLFRLTPDESERLLALIAERDESAVTAPAADGAAQAEQTDPVGEALEWVTFHPSYSYEDFVEGFRPAQSDAGARLALEDGIFKTMCERARTNPKRTYLLVVDEINRANLTKVLGELITLIEKDKRAEPNDARYSARLPYSKEEFTIPANLFILGTMNTADRSIKMMDTALRRRFGFVELMPDPSLLASEVSGLRLDDLLRALNERVAKEAGREKQIGHSFFLNQGEPITDEAEFAEIFRDEIVPLLQEYAVDDYDELAEYLGPKIVDRDHLTLDNEILSDPSLLLDALEEHLLSGQAEE